ncbi:hypothetical protein BH11PLA2_BH11PLA2_27940 [soil metagenome]
MRLLTLFGLLFLHVTAFAAEPPIEEIKGSLVIVGGGKLPDVVRDRFVKLAGGDTAKIVVIPTASESADKPAEHESFLAAWKKLNPSSVVLLHTRDKATADTDAFIKPLADATGVWFSGGDQSKVTAAYLGTKTETALRAVLARGGVLGGTSAGAALMSEPMITGGTATATFGPGFGFLPGVIVDQHFVVRKRQPRLVGMIEKHPGSVGIGIDEATAIVVRGRTIEVLGESTATVLLSPGAGRSLSEQVLKAKQTADLFQLRRAAANRAAKEPFPPKTPPKPSVEKGSLVIVGGGGTTREIMDRFFDLAGGKDSLVVVIPTANEGTIEDNPDDAKYLQRWGGTNIKVLHTKDRKKADDPEFSKILEQAKGVWFGGGRQWRFVDSYENTLTHKRFHEVLARGGVIGGSSAGASIQSEYMPRGHPLGNTVMDAEGYERGFGFLPGAAVDQHFFARKRFADMSGLIKRYPQYLGLGIDEATALLVKGDIAEVLGKSKAAVFDGKPHGDKDYLELSVGDKYDLVKRALAK